MAWELKPDISFFMKRKLGLLLVQVVRQKDSDVKTPGMEPGVLSIKQH